jgi:hypothetical protein
VAREKATAKTNKSLISKPAERESGTILLAIIDHSSIC